MGKSKQMTFTLACAVVLSALVPGMAGYISARMEAIATAERNLQALETRLNVREARVFPAPCTRHPLTPRLHQGPAAALEGRWHRRHTARNLPAWLPELIAQLRQTH